LQEICALAPSGDVTYPWHGLLLSSCRTSFVQPDLDAFRGTIFEEAADGDLVSLTGDMLAARLAYTSSVSFHVLDVQPMRMESLDAWLVVRIALTFRVEEGMMQDEDAAGGQDEVDQEGEGFGDLDPVFECNVAPGRGRGRAPEGHMDFLEQALGEIMEEDDAEQEEFLALARAEAELALDDECIIAGEIDVAANASAVLASDMPAYDLDDVVGNACRCLSLELRPNGAGLYTFADASSPLIDKMTISKVRRGIVETLKCTCRNRKHGNCVVWLSTDTSSPSVFRSALLDLLQWEADGRDQSESEHHQSGVVLKRKHGMRIK
jgi:hypothetical protein